MSATKLCMICKHENLLTSKQCEQCGAPLSPDMPTFIPPSDVREIINFQINSAEAASAPPGGAALYVNGEKQPIIISEPGKTILGRYNPRNGENAIDLSIFYAHLLGVSRAHAAITSINKTHTLEDLNSTNGTFINDRQLTPNQPYPLNSGDLIRLGQLLMIIKF